MRFQLPLLRSTLAPALTGLALSVSPFAVSMAHAEPSVIASIKPVHSLVAAVMKGVGEPELLVDGASSPHGYQMKPSQAGQLQSADVVFWVGPELESFLVKPVETIAGSAQSVPLIDAAGVTRLAPREGGTFEHHDHAHEGEAHENHESDDHAHSEHADEAHKHEHEEAHEHGHDHGEVDPHVWLDPENAKAFVAKIVTVLSAADPANAETYAANGKAEEEKLDTLIETVNQTLDPVRDRSFIVFHDAYHYFENRFGMEASGSITVNPELRPGAERISEIQTKLKSLKAACVFAEPQFEPKIVSVAIEGSDAHAGTLDPVGAELTPGPDLYPALIENLAKSMSDCLSEKS
ncbi:zinc ABC transporter substrate-binding protein ZnuA [Pseudohoeflea suaedae]|uniref:High-affinity zinc uptake system protein ZnuA n=1 Tax=Pseudohoeflea suaedae TaxID=877384 RepID=A0A4R5PN81_9HYPH|nr:zinc ABC transporter substrate-binding protein ZnuA [Pseudohoeflea suaedae]TDH38510.1 zinc ABC transporter substrate-binding protein ZnuA [Pseudohoeflea suaedae]